jgi:hypothetical protein
MNKKLQSENIINIIGAAGTGKTFTVVKYFVNMYSPREVLFLSPTHKAKEVLENFLKQFTLKKFPVKTTDSFLGFRPHIHPKTGETIYAPKGIFILKDGQGRRVYTETCENDSYEFTLDEDWLVSVSSKQHSGVRFIIQDEASMIDAMKMKYLQEAVEKKKFKLIMMGDCQQLHPVNDKMLFPVGDYTVLETNVRTNKPDLQKLLSYLRDNVGKQIPDFVKDIMASDNVEFCHGVNLQEIKNSITDGKIVKVIAHTNQKVREFNEQIKDFMRIDWIL